MPSKERRLGDLMNAFLEANRKKGRARVTLDDYRWLILKTYRVMQEHGVEPNPQRWDEDAVHFLRNVAFAHLEPSVARRQMAVLNTFALFHGNPVIKELNLEWPRDARTHVDWLTPYQAMQVMEAASGIERIVVHLELCLGLRRVEVLRLRVKDLGLGYVNVLGKGRQGGKPRTLAFHPRTLSELSLYQEIREAEIARARARNPSVAVPEALLIYSTAKGDLRAYQRTAVDKMLSKVSQKSGMKFTNHTLRRTFGRTAFLAGVPLEVISSMLGHEDTKTTILYLGLNMDDQTAAMSRIAEFQNALKPGKTGPYPEGKSGQSGI